MRHAWVVRPAVHGSRRLVTGSFVIRTQPESFVGGAVEKALEGSVACDRAKVAEGEGPSVGLALVSPRTNLKATIATWPEWTRWPVGILRSPAIEPMHSSHESIALEFEHGDDQICHSDGHKLGYGL